MAQIPTQDVIGIYDENLNQLFVNARPIRLRIREVARVMKHPLETGVTISEFIVYDPNEIEISMILTPGNYQATYQSIKQFFKNAALLSVQTKTSVYKNMIISELPHEEDAEMFDAIGMNLKLIEALFATGSVTTYSPAVTANPTTPAESKDTSALTTVQSGNKMAQIPPPISPAQSQAFQDAVIKNAATPK